MDKIKKLNHFQQGILILMTVMALIEYKDTILVPNKTSCLIFYVLFLFHKTYFLPPI